MPSMAALQIRHLITLTILILTLFIFAERG
jgi:hypothetical protein